MRNHKSANSGMTSKGTNRCARAHNHGKLKVVNSLTAQLYLNSDSPTEVNYHSGLKELTAIFTLRYLYIISFSKYMNTLQLLLALKNKLFLQWENQEAPQAARAAVTTLCDNHPHPGKWGHREVNTASLSLVDTQRLQGYLCYYSYVFFNHDMPHTRCLLSLMQSSLEKFLYSLFENRIFK